MSYQNKLKYGYCSLKYQIYTTDSHYQIVTKVMLYAYQFAITISNLSFIYFLFLEIFIIIHNH